MAVVARRRSHDFGGGDRAHREVARRRAGRSCVARSRPRASTIRPGTRCRRARRRRSAPARRSRAAPISSSCGVATGWCSAASTRSPAREVRIGIVPAGTANLLATNLGIPRDIERAVRIALHGHVRKLDVGCLNGERFAVMAGAGWDALMIRDADGALKDRLGRVAYVWTGARHLREEQFRARHQGRRQALVRRQWRAACSSATSAGSSAASRCSRAPRPTTDGSRSAWSPRRGRCNGAAPWRAPRSGRRPSRRSSRPRRRTRSGSSSTAPCRYELDGGARDMIRRMRIDVEPGAIAVCVPEESPRTRHEHRRSRPRDVGARRRRRARDAETDRRPEAVARRVHAAPLRRRLQPRAFHGVRDVARARAGPDRARGLRRGREQTTAWPGRWSVRSASAVPGPASRVLTDAVTQAYATGASSRWLPARARHGAARLITGSTLFGQLERGLNRIYGVEQDRPSVQKYGLALLLTVTAGALLGGRVRGVRLWSRRRFRDSARKRARSGTSRAGRSRSCSSARRWRCCSGCPRAADNRRGRGSRTGRRCRSCCGPLSTLALGPDVPSQLDVRRHVRSARGHRGAPDLDAPVCRSASSTEPRSPRSSRPYVRASPRSRITTRSTTFPRSPTPPSWSRRTERAHTVTLGDGIRRASAAHGSRRQSVHARAPRRAIRRWPPSSASRRWRSTTIWCSRSRGSMARPRSPRCWSTPGTMTLATTVALVGGPRSGAARQDTGRDRPPLRRAAGRRGRAGLLAARLRRGRARIRGPMATVRRGGRDAACAVATREPAVRRDASTRPKGSRWLRAPARPGGPPIWIGSWGSDAGLRRAARSGRRLAGVGVQHHARGVRRRVEPVCAGSSPSTARIPARSPNGLATMLVLHHRRPSRGRPHAAGTSGTDPRTGRRRCSGSVCRSARRSTSRRSSPPSRDAGLQRVFVWPVADEATTARAVLEQGAPARRWVEPNRMAERESVSAAKRAARLERREAALALRPSLSPTGPAPDRLRIATWNLNSLRRRLPAVERFLERVAPDVVCLQETKAASLSDAAIAMFEQHGYHAADVGGGSYNGVAVIARHPIDDARSSGEFDDEHLDREPRDRDLRRAHPDADARGVGVRPARPHDRPLALPVQAGVPRRAGRTDPAVAARRCPRRRRRRHQHRRDRQRRVPPECVRRVDPRDASPSATRSHVCSTPGWSTSTWPGGVLERDGSRGGRSASATRAISGMRLDMIATDTRLAARLDTTWIDHTERSTRPSVGPRRADRRLPRRRPSMRGFLELGASSRRSTSGRRGQARASRRCRRRGRGDQDAGVASRPPRSRRSRGRTSRRSTRSSMKRA